MNASVITTIPDNHQFTLLGWIDGFAYIEYQDQRGYVNSGYISRVE